MMSDKERPEGTVTIQTLAMPNDTNVYGDIFGGWLVSQMDLAGGLLAKHLSRGRAVTVAIQSMSFEQPVHVGDVVSCYVSLMKKGRSSMTVKVQVWINSPYTGEISKVTEGIFVYVAVNEQGKSRAIEDE